MKTAHQHHLGLLELERQDTERCADLRMTLKRKETVEAHHDDEDKV